ncbi:MAG: hypothetical protein J6A03_04350 [Lachnospiraceae bacterium]|nr:hypothetical protein [Lachnospiraceae bacterium]
MTNDKDEYNKDRIERIFPDYFNQYNIPPENAREESLEAYRACKTNRLERESFLPSYEENGCQFIEEGEEEDPSTFSLSVYEKPRDVRRFAIVNSTIRPPYKIAKGRTYPVHGVVLRTREYKQGYKKSSHIDWWLYKDAEPYRDFELIEDFKQFMEDRKRGETNE